MASSSSSSATPSAATLRMAAAQNRLAASAEEEEEEEVELEIVGYTDKEGRKYDSKKRLISEISSSATAPPLEEVQYPVLKVGKGKSGATIQEYQYKNPDSKTTIRARFGADGSIKYTETRTVQWTTGGLVTGTKQLVISAVDEVILVRSKTAGKLVIEAVSVLNGSLVLNTYEGMIKSLFNDQVITIKAKSEFAVANHLHKWNGRQVQRQYVKVYIPQNCPIDLVVEEARSLHAFEVRGTLVRLTANYIHKSVYIADCTYRSIKGKQIAGEFFMKTTTCIEHMELNTICDTVVMRNICALGGIIVEDGERASMNIDRLYSEKSATFESSGPMEFNRLSIKGVTHMCSTLQGTGVLMCCGLSYESKAGSEDVPSIGMNSSEIYIGDHTAMWVQVIGATAQKVTLADLETPDIKVDTDSTVSLHGGVHGKMSVTAKEILCQLGDGSENVSCGKRDGKEWLKN